jgi:hypothetical protein
MRSIRASAMVMSTLRSRYAGKYRGSTAAARLYCGNVSDSAIF